MFSYAVTCLIWGDDPNNTFTILFSKKTNIVDIKMKILKHLNLSNDMIDKLKYYKVEEELFSDDKRFKILKDKDSCQLISPEQLFNITKVNDVSSLIVSFTDEENSFNTEESIGAIIVVDDNINNIQPLKSRVSEKNKIIKNENMFNSFNEMNQSFYQEDDDENYNGDYEDDFSEFDNNKQSLRKYNINRKEKIKRQSLKEEKEGIKSRMCDCKKYLCNSIKDNNCSIHKKQDNSFKSTITSNNIPTPTKDIINMGATITMENTVNHYNKYNPNDITNANTSPTFVSSVSPNKVEVLMIKQSKTISVVTSEDISSDLSSIDISKNNLILKEETVEQITQENKPDLYKKSLKVQCTSNENINKTSDFLNSGNSMEPVLYTDSIPIQETIITEDESHFNPQTIDTSFYPRHTVSPKNNTNQISNSNGSNITEDSSSTKNKQNEKITTYNKKNNGYVQPSRIYYPESDIEVMEFNKNIKPSAPLENDVIEYNMNRGDTNPSNIITNINHYNQSTSELSQKSATSLITSGPIQTHKTTSTSPASPIARPPSISKSIIFGVEQFPSPPEPENEVDITNAPGSQTLQRQSKDNEVVVHQYYRNEMNDLPPSYENIDQQPSAPSLSVLNSNTALIENNHSNNNNNIETPDDSFEAPNLVRVSPESDDFKKHSDCCSCGCYPCNLIDSCMTEKLNIPSRWVGIIKAMCVLVLLALSGLTVFLIVFLSQDQAEIQHLDYSIYTITKVTTTVSGTNIITKTLVHRPLTIEETGGRSEPTPRSITSNTNEIDDFIIESDGRNTDEGLIQWTIKELTNPYLISSYFRPGSEYINNSLASATFQVSFDKIIEINDTIGINESESFYNFEVSKDKINFAFYTNNDSKTDIDIIKFSQYFENEVNKLNITFNYFFTSQAVFINEPKYALLNPQAARCLIEIENWDYKYENSKFVIKSGITSTDLVWSVKEENVINLNSSEGKIMLIDGVETARKNNERNATLSLYNDIVDFEDEGPIDVYYLIDNVKKSNYLLADIAVLLRSNILDIMTKEYEQNVNTPISSSSISRYSLPYFNFIQKIFNFNGFSHRYFFSSSSLFNFRQMKILSIFITLFIHLIIIQI
ncbi:hypothetical protein H8356DRAFT_1051607 [Neocallimastix lanati (nom. inval.)]|nr:hypothetical protein H8356DRAFT_1051607 [Neocallimastix sp. JGI-2020a]